MHKLVLGLFKGLKDLTYFFRIAFVFLILMLILYWVQNLIGAHWTWMEFIKYPLDWVLNIANNIYSFSFNFFGATVDLKYISAILILLLFAMILKFAYIGLEILEGIYKGAHYLCKKSEENTLNRQLKKVVEQEQKMLTKYSVYVQTKVQKKFSHVEQNVNLEEQNVLMNKFLIEKTGVQPQKYRDGFLYQFNDFFKVDIVLDAFFKILHSSAPLDYAICIQINNNEQELNKLIDFQNYGMISMAADTAYRYKYNETHRYQTKTVGVFQFNEGTIEVHEFREIL